MRDGIRQWGCQAERDVDVRAIQIHPPRNCRNRPPVHCDTVERICPAASRDRSQPTSSVCRQRSRTRSRIVSASAQRSVVSFPSLPVIE
jgi:hypothetical protein